MAFRPRRDIPQEPPPKPPPRPWELGDSDGDGTFGSWLRQQREIRNINLREISDSTKIGMRYLEALEQDRFEVLPAGVFARGFLREYAKYVGLDPDEVVTFYLAEEQERRAERGELEEEEPQPEPTKWRPSPRAVVIVLAVVAGLALLIWAANRARELGRAEQEAPPPIAAPVLPVPETAEPLPARLQEELVVTLGFTEECWVEAVVDGQPRVSELKVQGESMEIAARERVVLTLGNPGATRIEVNGEPFPIEVPPGGRVLRDLEIDRARAGLPPLEQDPEAGAPDRAGSRP